MKIIQNLSANKEPEASARSEPILCIGTSIAQLEDPGSLIGRDVNATTTHAYKKGTRSLLPPSLDEDSIATLPVLHTVVE